MASLSVLEKVITCSICYEVYRDPHALPCLHTLCKPCIDLLADRGRVECPECREITYVKKIRKDFKTQTLIDDHKNKEDAKKQSVTNCGFCSDPQKGVVSHCEECDLFLCDGCENGHKKIKVCANHTVRPLNDIIRIAKSKLADGVNQWQKKKLVTTRKSEEIDRSIEIIQDQQQRQIDKTNKHFDKLFSEVQKNREMLLEEIKEQNGIIIKDLRKNKELNEKLKVQIEIKMDMLQQVIDTDDITTIKCQMASDMEIAGKIGTIQDLVYTEGSSPVEVIVDGTFHLDTGIQLEKLSTNLAENGLSVNYDHLRNTRYNLSLSKDIGASILRMCMIKNKLWCAANQDGIQVYDMNLNLLQKIRSDKYSYVAGLSEWCEEGVIVACIDKSGLHHITQTGGYVQKIANGVFTDVSSYDRSIIALEPMQMRVIIFAYENNHWVHKRHFDVQDSMNFSNRFVVLDQSIFVSAHYRHCIHKYDTEGRNQQTIGQKGSHKAGELYYPTICSVDKSENILVADSDNHRLQVYYSGEQQWYVINLPFPQDNPEPVEAVLDHNGKNIWVVSKAEPRLMKFSIF